MIPFNKPSFFGPELDYIREAVHSGKISGDGIFSKKCQYFFESKYDFKKCLMTTSCTDALEMAAILVGIKEGDEVIMPSFTFVSTANAFVLRGARIVFCDSRMDHPGMNETAIESLITSKTKAIVVVHYAGVSVDMDIIMDIAKKYNLFVIEDAAQAIDSYYKGKALGSIGHLAAFSFHETKNIQCGEGGMLVINEEKFIKRSEIIREKGTNRAAFFRGEIDKYGWVDIGSSFLPSEITTAYLYAQLENINAIQKKRIENWNYYYSRLRILEDHKQIKLGSIPEYATNNAHMFYIVCKSMNDRMKLIQELKSNNVHSVFHYSSLHKSEFYKNKYQGGQLYNADRYSENLVRLPLYYDLEISDIQNISDIILGFYKNKKKV